MTADLVTQSTCGAPGGGVSDYVSPTRLNLWLKCPLAFKFRYVDGIKMPTTPALFVGRMVHLGLECWYRHRQLKIELSASDVINRLVQTWGQAAEDEGVRFKSAADEQARLKQSTDLVVAYVAKVTPNEPAPMAVETSIEAPLVDPTTGEDLGIPLVGVIDLVLPEADGPRIVDFKTSSRGGAPLEIAHEIQLGSYAYLLRHCAGQNETGLEIRTLVKRQRPLVQLHRYGARTDHHFGRLFMVIRAYLDDLDAGRFVFRPSLGCGHCDYLRSHCQGWCG